MTFEVNMQDDHSAKEMADDIRKILHDAIFNVPELENCDTATFLAKRLWDMGYRQSLLSVQITGQ